MDMDNVNRLWISTADLNNMDSDRNQTFQKQLWHSGDLEISIHNSEHSDWDPFFDPRL